VAAVAPLAVTLALGAATAHADTYVERGGSGGGGSHGGSGGSVQHRSDINPRELFTGVNRCDASGLRLLMVVVLVLGVGGAAHHAQHRDAARGHKPSHQHHS